MSKRRSFYHYVLTLRGPDRANDEQIFAVNVGKDIQFPKQAEDYETLANYLELHVDYVTSMDIFDAIWQKYLENN